MAYADRVPSSRRVTTLAAVAAIHGLIGYVFVSGMAASFVTTVTTELTIRNIPAETPPPPDPAPQPTQIASKQQPIQTIVTPEPVVPTTTDTSFTVEPVTPIIPITPIIGGGSGTVEITPPPPPLSKASGVRARGDRTRWISTEDYPPSAIRAGEQGVVAIAVQVDAAGKVTGCSVTASSGHDALDQATCRLYQRRGRFTAALDDTGTPIAATYIDRVHWVLPR
ncbi:MULTISPECIES: energy transducer TonB [unclassified Sphingomonas]|uniref:energy transducer TonB n=1 Tax=unclassified Sphingomonas TaxID=196159 RepID=UPI00161AA916|nr:MULTISPECIES: energy transducer TonB [unclassified Sphingomonas]MBB3346315.1 protein TonB [Sphingomonas sp. BK069]MBB3473374.1 protein TonB [Sphingomonas sp. BK345]